VAVRVKAEAKTEVAGPVEQALRVPVDQEARAMVGVPVDRAMAVVSVDRAMGGRVEAVRGAPAVLPWFAKSC